MKRVDSSGGPSPQAVFFGTAETIPENSDFVGTRRRRALQVTLAIAIGVIASIETDGMLRHFSRVADYLLWDPATHAMNGIRITTDLRELRVLDLVRDTNDQVLWPPLHSYLQVPFIFLMGDSFAASTRCSLFSYFLLFPALTWLYHVFDSSWVGWGVVMSLAATSPFYAGYSLSPMLEVFGASLTVLAVGLYLRESRLFPLSLTALFFLKYNYFLYVALPALWLSRETLFPELDAEKIKRTLRRPSRFQRFLVLYLLFFGVVALVGGVKIGPVTVTRLRNPAYLLLLIVVLRALFKKQLSVVWSRIRGSGWEWFVIPVSLWLILPYPNRVGGIIGFLINAPLGGRSALTLDYYSFYFERLHVYFANNALMVLCAATAVVTAARYYSRKDVRYLTLFFGLSWLLMTANQNKQDRYLFTFVFVLWLLCGYGCSRLRPFPRAISGCGLILYALVAYDPSLRLIWAAKPYIPEASIPMVDYAVNGVGLAKEVRILGARNDVSPALIEYHLRRRASSSGARVRLGLETTPPSGTHVVAFDREAPGTLLESRQFPTGRVGHYLISSSPP